MSRLALRTLYVLFVCAVVALGFGGWLYAEYTRPGPLAQSKAVVIPKGSGPGEIAGTLAASGVIRNSELFTIVVRLTGDDRSLRAGEFMFPARGSIRETVDILQTGRTVQRRLTIAEGLTTAEALRVIQAAEGLAGAIEPVPGEGELLPETYYYSWGDTRNEIVQRMREAMSRTLAELWQGRASGLPIESPESALVLAAIVEKETGVPDERPRVAAVFINRLRKGMRLQSDPTVVYAVTEGQTSLGRRLTSDDLAVTSAYNTYRFAGLPPGPICNPGADAIRAVLNPADTDEFYFVADGTGGHAFSRTLDEHNRKVRRWREIRDATETRSR
ncbi:MAG: endolytic transglycosylase MltG [Acetobacterales bacterium]